MVRYRFGFRVVAANLSLADVLIAMALDGGITIDYAQDVAVMVSALYVVVTEDIMKFNIDNKKEMEQHNIMLFISHSSKDEHIVKLLVNLIKNAFPIPSDKIRCTSLAGYGLDISDQGTVL